MQEVDYEIAEKRRDPFRRMIISYDTLFKIAETFNGRLITEFEEYSIEFDRVKKDMKYLIRRKRKTYWKSRYFVECIGKLCELHLRHWLGLDASFKVDLDKLSKLRKNYFKFNDKDKLEIGVSAQEIQAIYPEIVSTDDNGYLSVAYGTLSVIALAAIDELDDKILQLANKISTLENILNKLMGEKGVN